MGSPCLLFDSSEFFPTVFIAVYVFEKVDVGLAKGWFLFVEKKKFTTFWQSIITIVKYYLPTQLCSNNLVKVIV